MRALELVRDPSCDLSVVAATIERDVKLSASILAAANSIIYSPGRPICAVREAIVQVGLCQCQTLIQSCCAKSMMQSMPIGHEVRDGLLKHSLTTASFATAMNRQLELGFRGEEFAAGLLHDVGRLLLGVMYPEQLEAILPDSSTESVATEQAILGTDHSVVGCHFAISNRLPDGLAESIRYHHAPERAEIARELTAIVAIADHLANRRELNRDADIEVLHDTMVQAFGQEMPAKFKECQSSIIDWAETAYASFSTAG